MLAKRSVKKFITVTTDNSCSKLPAKRKKTHARNDKEQSLSGWCRLACDPTEQHNKSGRQIMIQCMEIHVFDTSGTLDFCTVF